MTEAEARVRDRRIGGSQIWHLLQAASHSIASIDYFFKLTLCPPSFKGNAYTEIGKLSEDEFANMWLEEEGVLVNPNLLKMEVEPEDDVMGSTDLLRFAITPDVMMPDYIIEIKTTCPSSAPYSSKAPPSAHKAQLLCYMALTGSHYGTLYNAQWYRNASKEWTVIGKEKLFHYYFEKEELLRFSRDLREVIHWTLRHPKRSNIEAAKRVSEFIKKKNATTNVHGRLKNVSFIGTFDDSTCLGSLLASVAHD